MTLYDFSLRSKKVWEEVNRKVYNIYCLSIYDVFFKIEKCVKINGVLLNKPDIYYYVDGELVSEREFKVRLFNID